jgi:N-acyl-D-aspartate/D-glutamate deacylase
MISSVGIYGGGLMVQHMHQQTLDDTQAALAMIEDAQKKGLKGMAEIYPYNYGATVVGADYLVPENYGPNMGRDYSDITEVATMKPLDKARYDELIKTNPTASVMFVGIDEKKMLAAVDWDTPYDVVQGHPRSAGTHAKVLRLVRDQDLMPLMLAISKMSYMPAKFLEENGVPQMKNKGRIQVGADADVTVFNPETVTDNATLKQAGMPSTGIPYVLVNGTIVVKDSKVLAGVFPGKPVRRAVQ